MRRYCPGRSRGDFVIYQATTGLATTVPSMITSLMSRGELRYANLGDTVLHGKAPTDTLQTLIFVFIRTVPRSWLRRLWYTLKAQGFDFSGLTSDSADYVYAINVFLTREIASITGRKGCGPTPRVWWCPSSLRPASGGKRVARITNMGSELSPGDLLPRERTHGLRLFDLYDYGYESRGIGAYCLMYAGANVERKESATGRRLSEVPCWLGAQLDPDFSRFECDDSSRQQRLLEFIPGAVRSISLSRTATIGPDRALPASGLAIWHVEELGSNNNEQRTAALYYECSLIQADGALNLENGDNDGDATDLFHFGGNFHFGGTTNPGSGWWDGNASNLEIRDIGPAGPVMTFRADI